MHLHSTGGHLRLYVVLHVLALPSEQRVAIADLSVVSATAQLLWLADRVSATGPRAKGQSAMRPASVNRVRECVKPAMRDDGHVGKGCTTGSRKLGYAGVCCRCIPPPHRYSSGECGG